MYLGHSPVPRFRRCDMSPRCCLRERPRGELRRPASKPETKTAWGIRHASFLQSRSFLRFSGEYTVQSDPDLPDYFPLLSRPCLKSMQDLIVPETFLGSDAHPPPCCPISSSLRLRYPASRLYAFFDFPIPRFRCNVPDMNPAVEKGSGLARVLVSAGHFLGPSSLKIDQTKATTTLPINIFVRLAHAIEARSGYTTP
jgi:hypothetical protein